MDAPSRASEDDVISGMQRGAWECGLQGFGKAAIARMMDSSMGGVLFWGWVLLRFRLRDGFRGEVNPCLKPAKHRDERGKLGVVGEAGVCVQWSC